MEREENGRVPRTTDKRAEAPASAVNEVFGDNPTDHERAEFWWAILFLKGVTELKPAVAAAEREALAVAHQAVCEAIKAVGTASTTVSVPHQRLDEQWAALEDIESQLGGLIGLYDVVLRLRAAA